MLATINSLVVLAQIDGWDHHHGGYWWIWGLGMFILWFLFIFLIYFGFRRWGWGCGWGPRHELSGVERARGILAERYARGEINVEEYEERLSRLRDTNAK